MISKIQALFVLLFALVACGENAPLGPDKGSKGDPSSSEDGGRGDPANGGADGGANNGGSTGGIVGGTTGEPVINEVGKVPSELWRKGARLFEDRGCAKCHGEDGAGSSAPSLHGLDERDRDQVFAAISQRMPPNAPGSCVGECAETLTDFVREVFAESETSCEAILPASRAVRLLSRREYVQTISTLFQLGPATGTCGEHSFRYKPQNAADQVLVAGGFTEWRTNALPLTKQSDGSYERTLTLLPGRHEYKFVVVRGGQDEWVSDPNAASTGDQGNSVLEITCNGANTALTPQVIFGLLRGERLADGVFFDTSAISESDEGATEAYLNAAERLATSADLNVFMTCDVKAGGAGCSEQIVSNLGKKVFRRPLTVAEITRYSAVLSAATDAKQGMIALTFALLSSPSFLYRTELGLDKGGGLFELTPYELASALSYMLTGDMPDGELMSAADSGALSEASELEKQAKRLLYTAQGRRTMVSQVLQWLGVQDAASIQRDPKLYPDLGTTLPRDMLEETRRFVEHVLFDSQGTLEELLTADYTFASKGLAAHYGLSAPAKDFDVVPYGDSGRRGIMGHGSVLATYANPDATSPTKRGLFVRRHLMCQRFGTPPANAGVINVTDPSLTTRERFAQHTEVASCASCHQHIDPVGFSFEGFGAAGEPRPLDHNKPVDTSGFFTGEERLGDGSERELSSVADLASALVDAPATHSCAARQSYRFTHGAVETPLNSCAARYVLQQYGDKGGRLLEIPLAVVRSVDFRFRY
jgi:cytochrome c553